MSAVQPRCAPRGEMPGAEMPAAEMPGAEMPAAEMPGAEMPGADPAPCHDEVCITCSDTAVAVTIVRLLEDDLAVVDTGEGEEEVSIALVSAGIGDTVLVHAREAIAVVG